jgi:hypothetical protein
MKRIAVSIVSFIVLLAIIVFISGSCKKDTDCQLLVVTKLYNDTTVVVPEAEILIKTGDIYVEGVTNSKGEFEHTFKLEAIVNVSATDKSTIPNLKAEGTVRLVPGKKVRKLLLLK